MNVHDEFSSRIRVIVRSLEKAGVLTGSHDPGRIRVSPPRDAGHGDLASNAAMVLARNAAGGPREIAEHIAALLREDPDVAGVDIAGPGFVNITLARDFWLARLRDLLESGPESLVPDIGRGGKACVEYVSANPTGPPHVGTARGAVFGDALASLLEAVGWDVTREYYINDAGAQVDTLAWSAYLRYLQALGEPVDETALEGLYPGEYLVETGGALAGIHGTALRDAVGDCEPGTRPLPAPLEPVRTFVTDRMMDIVREDLALIGVRQDVFSSERDMVQSGGIERCLEKLEGKGLLYTGVLEPPRGKEPEDWEPVPQTLFRATRFGDDLDRPLRKSDGSWSYFAPDIAYHNTKVERGFDLIINVFGADHAGYVKRLKAAVAALSDGKARFDILLTQLVRFMDNDEVARMSKRSGRYVTLREVAESVGKDVVRFIMLTRRNDVPLDFDPLKVQEQSKDNPVFYVHYAHARTCSVLRKATSAGIDTHNLAGASSHLLVDDSEIALVRTLAGWPGVVAGAAEAHEPHRIATWLNGLAADFHSLWNKGRDDPDLRFIVEDDVELTRARLALIDAVRQVIASGLRLFGVETREEMR